MTLTHHSTGPSKTRTTAREGLPRPCWGSCSPRGGLFSHGRTRCFPSLPHLPATVQHTRAHAHTRSGHTAHVPHCPSHAGANPARALVQTGTPCTAPWGHIPGASRASPPLGQGLATTWSSPACILTSREGRAFLELLLGSSSPLQHTRPAGAALDRPPGTAPHTSRRTSASGDNSRR